MNIFEILVQKQDRNLRVVGIASPKIEVRLAMRPAMRLAIPGLLAPARFQCMKGHGKSRPSL